MKTPVTRISILCLFLQILCSCDSSYHQQIFEDTFDKVLELSVHDYRYRKAPTFQEFMKGRTYQSKKIDSLSKLKVVVIKEPIRVDFRNFQEKLPNSYKSILDKDRNEFLNSDYISQDINHYKSKNLEIKFKNNLDVKENLVFKGLDFGGYVQFSQVHMNKEENLALVFLRLTRTSANSIEKIILFRKFGDHWEVYRTIGISMA